jgi:hypothetical protein
LSYLKSGYKYRSKKVGTKANLPDFVFFDARKRNGTLKPARGGHSMVIWWKKECLIDCFSYLGGPVQDFSGFIFHFMVQIPTFASPKIIRI